MSAESSQWLNTMILIGMTEQRGNAWHYRAADQGTESNHYTGAIPVADVIRRLFNFTVEKTPLTMSVPTDDLMAADGMDDNGIPFSRMPVTEFVAFRHSATGHVFTVGGKDRAVHQYQDWLIDGLGSIVGTERDDLVISSAGLLRKGGRAWVEVSIPETIHDSETGFSFRPNVVGATGHDGTLATTYARTVTATVCDNTLAWNLGEAANAGLMLKIKRTVNSNLKLRDARNTLAIVENTGDVFTAGIRELAKIKVSDRVWQEFTGIWAPTSDDPNKAASNTRAERKREEITGLWNNSPMVTPWRGTALGVVQAVNTWQHHLSEIRGSDRVTRNSELALSAKGVNSMDTGTVELLNRALATVG